MEKDTPRHNRRAAKPPAALFVAPVETEETEPEAVPHQPAPPAKPPVGVPFAANTPSPGSTPTSSSTTPERTKPVRTAPEQLTFGDPVPPVTARTPTSPVTKPFAAKRPAVTSSTLPDDDAPVVTPAPRRSLVARPHAEPAPVDLPLGNLPAARAKAAPRGTTAPPTMMAPKPVDVAAAPTSVGPAKAQPGNAQPAKAEPRNAQPRNVAAPRKTAAPKARTSADAPIQSTPVTPTEAAPAAETAQAETTPRKIAPVKTGTAKPTPKQVEPRKTTPAKATPSERVAAEAEPALEAPEATKATAAVKKATVAKKTAPKKAARKKLDSPVQLELPPPEDPHDFTDVVPLERGRTRGDLPSDADLTRAVKARPQLAMAALALVAVGRFGESAIAQAEWLRNTYPLVAADRLARVAVATAMKRTRYAVGASIVGGPIGVAAGVSTLTWAKARLVLDVAAILGHDPLDPTRAADVLVLLGVYPDGLAAAKAVAELADDASGTDVKARDSLLASASAQLVTRAAGRILPGLGALALASVTMTETERLAEAAIRYYRRSLRQAF